MKKFLLIAGVSAGIMMTLGGCSSGGNSYYAAPQPQEKNLEQVAQDEVNSLSAKETAQINKLSKKK
jgi:hypothetical protein